MIAGQRTYRFGDVVIHPKRPEWGRGVVARVETISQDGRPAQRLHVRFANEGLKVINTGIAPVMPADEGAGMADSGMNAAGRGWLAELEQKDPQTVMTELAEQARDPFASVWDRLSFIIGLYRFSLEARSLTDWAVAQSGLADPLSQFSRQELEAFFRRWTSRRDDVFFETVREAQGRDPERVRTLVAQGPEAAATALRRLNGRR